MESLGKSVDRNGDGIFISNCIIWGSIGPNLQHPFWSTNSPCALNLFHVISLVLKNH